LAVASVVIYFTWAAANLQYELADDELVIKWAFNKKRIPLSAIKGIGRTVGTSSMKVMGASWPGFHIGSFTSPTGHGMVNMYGTRLWGDIVLIRTKWEIIGITPVNPEELTDRLHELVPGLEPDSITGGEPLEPFSPWRDKKFLAALAATAIILVGTAVYLLYMMPSLPSRVPLHYDLSGQVNRYGSPRELFIPFGIGAAITALMIGLTTTLARNNRASIYMAAYVSIFIALLFSAITIGMVFSVI